jgi:hypothetical protein
MGYTGPAGTAGPTGPTGTAGTAGPTGPSPTFSTTLQDANLTNGNFNGYTTNAYFTSTQSWDFDNYDYTVLFEYNQTVSVGDTHLQYSWFDDVTAERYCYWSFDLIEGTQSTNEINEPVVIFLNGITSSSGTMNIQHYIKITFTRPRFSTNTILGNVEHSSTARDSNGYPNRTYKSMATIAYSSTSVTTGVLSSRLVFYNDASGGAVANQGYCKITRKPRAETGGEFQSIGSTGPNGVTGPSGPIGVTGSTGPVPSASLASTMLIGNKASTTLDMSNNEITNVTTLTATTVTPTTVTGWNVKSLVQGSNVTITNNGVGAYTINSTNPTSVYSLYWGDGTVRCAKITFTLPVTVDLRFNRVRCTLKVRAVLNYLNYPILCFNDNHTYPSYNNYTTEASQATTLWNGSTSNYFTHPNNAPVVANYGDYSMCFANPTAANSVGTDPYWILDFYCDLTYDRATGTYLQMVAKGTWALVDKSLGSSSNVIFWSGTFTRLSELAGPTYNLSKIGFGAYSNGGNFNSSIRTASINVEVIPTSFTYQSGGGTT